MIKKIFLFTIILFIGGGLHAQDSTQKAKTLLDQVSSKVKSYDNMVIKFDYIQQDDAQNTTQKTKGSVALKGDKYKLDLMGTTRIFDGEKLYNIIPEDEEINIANYDPEADNELSPSKLFNFYEEGYSYKWDITQKTDGRKIQYIKLKPEDENADSEIKEVLLGVDAQTKHIRKLIQTMNDDTQLIIDVKSFKTNQPLSENMFKFNADKYQGYYINRLD